MIYPPRIICIAFAANLIEATSYCNIDGNTSAVISGQSPTVGSAAEQWRLDLDASAANGQSGDR